MATTPTPTPPPTHPEPHADAELRDKIARLEAQLELLLKQGRATTDQAPRPLDVTRVVPQAPNRDPDNPKDPNPCACEHCTPHRVHHWYCTVCGRGPFRFEKSSPGRGPVAHPPFRRQMQRYLTVGHYVDRDGEQKEVQQWIYWVRYACSPACAAVEQSVALSDQWETVQKHPSAARAVAAQSEALEAVLGAPPPDDDLAR